MSLTDMSSDFFCDEVVHANSLFISEVMVHVLRKDLMISSNGSEEDAIVE